MKATFFQVAMLAVLPLLSVACTRAVTASPSTQPTVKGPFTNEDSRREPRLICGHAIRPIEGPAERPVGRWTVVMAGYPVLVDTQTGATWGWFVGDAGQGWHPMMQGSPATQRASDD